MVTVQIGNEERQLADAIQGWIHEHLNRRRRDQVPVCVRVRIAEKSVDITVTSAGCGRG